jgi:omega-amidase
VRAHTLVVSHLPVTLYFPSPEFKVACVQISVTADKTKNLTTAAAAVAKAAATGAKIIVLPEMFNCPYANTSFFS